MATLPLAVILVGTCSHCVPNNLFPGDLIMNRYLYTLSLLLLSAWPALGDTPAKQPSPDDISPEKIVASSMEAARKRDWERYADLIHPESLNDYKRMWRPTLEAAAASGEE